MTDRERGGEMTSEPKSPKLKLYSVMPDSGSEWQVLVAARTVREAKRLGWTALPERCDYTDVRVKLLPAIAVPESITEPQCWDTCVALWMCQAWQYHPDLCGDCHNSEAKRVEADDD